jgi:tetratricopeptide (TPR) repeat protein
MPSPPSDPGSNWFSDPATLVEEITRAHRARGQAPSISGYDDIVELRRGGQGVVYAAVQRSTKRRVAIKILLEGSASSLTTRRRFEREIDLVAALKHPGIVAVYDSGLTLDGRLYLVMEYIEGVPLDEAIAALKSAGDARPIAHASPPVPSAQSPVPSILSLFIKITDALQYAHQHGVIHRDLKPANIRVDKAGAGDPHILDFGLAKATEGSARPEDSLTITGHFMGSLAWASPEQVGASPKSDAADLRTDIYAVGVMLYHALTGRFPYDVSAAKSGGGGGAGGGSGLRATLDNILYATPEPPERSNPTISADLGTIVLKCLAKEPGGRYQSAGELAQDLRHALAGEPIEARGRSGAWTALRRTVRRYQLAAGVAVAATIAVAAALVVAVIALRSAVHQRDLARAQTARATATSQFLTDIIGAVDPDKDGRDVKVADLLSRAADRIDARFPTEPETSASLHHTIGKDFAKLGLFEVARDQYLAGLKIRRVDPGPDDPRTLNLEHDLGVVFWELGKPAEAEQQLRATWESQRRVLGESHPDTISTLNGLGLAIKAQGRGRYAEAEEIYRRALDLHRATVGDDNSETLSNLVNLASLFHDLGRLDEAEPLYRQALAAQERTLGPDNTETLLTASNVAMLLLDRSSAGGPRAAADIADAEAGMRHVLDAYTRILGPDHNTTLVAANNLAKLLQDKKRYDEAEPLMRTVLQTRRRTLGPDHRDTLLSLGNLSSLLGYMNRDEECLALVQEALAARRRVLGDNTLDTAVSMNNLAMQLRKMKRPEEAEPLLREAVAVTATVLPAGHWIHAAFQSNLGSVLTDLHRYDQAQPELKAAYDALLAAPGIGPDHAQTKKCRANLKALYTAWDKPDQAAALDIAAPSLK